MKNFIFISPNFPAIYWRFCKELKNNGLRVLGIGDSPYDELTPELKDALHEYYKVSSLENYDEVFRAVAFFSFKYGKIDWLESNNEYWLERDAMLRSDFNITTGFKAEQMESVKRKSAMKAYYTRAKIPVARYHLVQDFKKAKAFAKKVGYPVIVKPDNGVGASHTYRLHSDEELQTFLNTKDDSLYIMEEMVKGYVCTYDAIINADGEPLFEASNVTPHSLMDVVNEGGEAIMYLMKQIPADIRDFGLRTVKVFGVKSRFVHLEFFRLSEDQPGLGKAGELVGLEVNMRPAGGYIPDMYNFSAETDVYKIWADMVAFNRSTKPEGNHHYCAFCGRRDGKQYAWDHAAICEKYRGALMMERRIPDALADCMGNHMYVVNVDTEEELQNFFRDILA